MSDGKRATSVEYVNQARDGNYVGIPYAELDCQGFVERVLRDTGHIWHNWRGSNHMYREAIVERKTFNDNGIVPGCWVFKVRYDGGEKERGYYDELGNAYHVGLYMGGGLVMHSTNGGVQWGDYTSAWTHWGRVKDVQYTDEVFSETEVIEVKTEYLRAILDELATIEAYVRDMLEGV